MQMELFINTKFGKRKLNNLFIVLALMLQNAINTLLND